MRPHLASVRLLPRKLLWRAAPRRTVHARGLRFTLQCDNWITHYRWSTYNTKEPETLDWIDRWIRDGDTFFDIGANIGLYTIYAALRHPAARIIAFEPEYANLHLLRDNLIQNGVHDRVEVYSVALGNHTGISRLHIQDFTPGAALHTESQAPLRRTRTERSVIWQEGIGTFTLDQFCEETQCAPTCLKIDVDGTEREILEGAARTLQSTAMRSLIVELSEEPSIRGACERLLATAGLRREMSWSQPERCDNQLWVRSA
ncbi:MAG: FkbM family methyltransferase [Candidatus Omnitrophica bacterium]|nr:FkbM family methyltransferase [Candidatus Omnitrophota bacterium]